MTVFYSSELASITATPVVKAASAGYGARLIRFRGTVTYASQTTSDTIVVAIVPAGYAFAFGILTTDTSSGSTTISIGITGTVAKYKALAAFTTTDTPTFFGKASAVSGATLTADETIFLTLAAATAPASGTLVVDMYFSRQ